MKKLYNWFFKPRIIERNGRYTVAKYRGRFLVVCEETSYYYPPDRWRKKCCCCFKNCFYDLAFAQEMLKYINTDYSIRDYKVKEQGDKGLYPLPLIDAECNIEKEIC